MLVLDVSIINIALADLQRDLSLAPSTLQWVVSAYALTFGGFLILAGRAADLWGRRRFFLLGLALFSAASLGGGFARSAGVLIAARALQGLGAALASPAALSLLTTSFAEGLARNQALGVWGAVAAAGAAAGLLVGGALTDQLGWPWVFFVNVPVGLLAIGLGPLLLRESRAHTQHHRLDLPGAVLITGGLGTLVATLTNAERAGLASSETFALLALAIALLTAFVLVERRAADPLLPLQIFRRRSLTGANLVSLLLAAVIAGHGFFASLFMQQVLGYSPFATGLAFLPLTLTVMVTANLSARAVGRVGPRQVMAFGMSMATLGLLWMVRLPLAASYLTDLLPGFLCIAVGLGATFVPATITATAGVLDAEQGVASGLLTTAQQVGNAVGLAVLVAVAAGVSDGQREVAALASGFRWGYGVAALLAALGIVVALVIVPGRSAAARPTAVLRP